MKRTIKIVSMSMVLILALSMFSMVAFATSAKPYSSYSASILDNNKKGEGVIYACSCTPVSNYLKSTVNVQYYQASSGTYKWTGNTSGSANNTPGRVSSWTVFGSDYVKYVDASFEAKCGTGSIKYYSATKSN